jgi:hypothetical protein
VFEEFKGNKRLLWVGAAARVGVLIGTSIYAAAMSSREKAAPTYESYNTNGNTVNIQGSNNKVNNYQNVYYRRLTSEPAAPQEPKEKFSQ